MSNFTHFLSKISLAVAVLMIPFTPILLGIEFMVAFGGGTDGLSLPELIFLISYAVIHFGLLDVGIQQKNTFFTLMSLLNVWSILGLTFHSAIHFGNNIGLVLLFLATLSEILLGFSALRFRDRFGVSTWFFFIVHVSIGLSIVLLITSLDVTLLIVTVFLSFISDARLLAINKNGTPSLSAPTSKA